jgi:APA family basic amino acid/polyamine antiporter
MLTVLVPSSLGFFAQAAFWHLRDAGLARGAWLPDAVIVGLVLANVWGLRAGALVQNALTVLKVLGVAAMALFAWALGGGSSAAATAPATTQAAPGVLDFVGAMVPVLWAYDGWIDVTSVAGEVRDPRRSIPRALVFGTCAVAALYLVANGGLLAALGHGGLAAIDRSSTVFSEGPWQRSAARPWLAALVAVACVGGGAVGLMSGARVVFAVARDGLLFAPLGRVSARGVPAVALVACGAIALLYVHSPLGRLGEVFVVGAWPFYALGAVAVVRLRRRGAFERTEPATVEREAGGYREAAFEREGQPFRTPWFPWPQVVFALVSVAIVAGYAARERFNTAASLGAILAGLLVFPLFARARDEAPA